MPLRRRRGLLAEGCEEGDAPACRLNQDPMSDISLPHLCKAATGCWQVQPAECRYAQNLLLEPFGGAA